MDFLVDNLNARVLAMIFAAVAAIATVLTLAMPLLATDSLGKRMKSVGAEREKLRQRERERLARGVEKVALRQTPKQYMQRIVDQFNLNKWVGQEEARALLVQAGYRGQAPYITYLFFRLVMPGVMLAVSLFYFFLVLDLDQPATVKVGLCIGCTYFGMYLPSLFLKNQITRIPWEGSIITPRRPPAAPSPLRSKALTLTIG
jgi:tight adherence protein C